MGRVALVGGAGVVLALVVLLISRRGHLSMRYTLGWFLVAGFLVLGGVFGPFVDVLARTFHVEPVTVMLTAVLAGFLVICVQLSISVSGLTEAVRTLAEANALLEERVRSTRNETARCDPAETTSPSDPVNEVPEQRQ